MEPRKTAWSILCRVIQEGGYANLLLRKLPEDSTREDRALVCEIVYGTLRNQTMLELQWKDSEDADLLQAVKTPDGGYAALLREQKSEWWSGEWYSSYAVIKLDAEGRVQWIRKLAEKDEGEYYLCAYKGKIVVLYDPREEMDKPQVLRWFDGEGNETGRTELALKPEYFPAMAGKTAPKSKKIPRVAHVNTIRLIPAEDGLWAYVTAYLADYHKADNELAMVADSQDAIMIRVEEPLP